MTEVKFHGYLSKIFNNSLKLHLGRLNDIVAAIDSVKNGFRNKILQLQNEGFAYTICKEKNILNIIPVISGSGRTVMRVLSVVFVVVGVVLLFVPGFQGLGLNLISMGLQIGMQAFTPLPKLRFPSSSGSVGGSSFSARKGNKSFMFQNKENIASQGSLIRIGYGKLKINSNTISISIKNYSTNVTFESENNFTEGVDSTSILSSAFTKL